MVFSSGHAQPFALRPVSHERWAKEPQFPASCHLGRSVGTHRDVEERGDHTYKPLMVQLSGLVSSLLFSFAKFPRSIDCLYRSQSFGEKDASSRPVFLPFFTGLYSERELHSMQPSLVVLIGWHLFILL